jgi:hypothetical protein
MKGKFINQVWQLSVLLSLLIRTQMCDSDSTEAQDHKTWLYNTR